MRVGSGLSYAKSNSRVNYGGEAIYVTDGNEEYKIHFWNGVWYMDVTIHTFPEHFKPVVK